MQCIECPNRSLTGSFVRGRVHGMNLESCYSDSQLPAGDSGGDLLTLVVAHEVDAVVGAMDHVDSASREACLLSELHQADSSPCSEDIQAARETGRVTILSQAKINRRKCKEYRHKCTFCAVCWGPGTRSDGLRTNVFPVAMARGNIQRGIMAGKLKGAMPAQTPRGCNDTSQPVL